MNPIKLLGTVVGVFGLAIGFIIIISHLVEPTGLTLLAISLWDNIQAGIIGLADNLLSVEIHPYAARNLMFYGSLFGFLISAVKTEKFVGTRAELESYHQNVMTIAVIFIVLFTARNPDAEGVIEGIRAMSWQDRLSLPGSLPVELFGLLVFALYMAAVVFRRFSNRIALRNLVFAGIGAAGIVAIEYALNNYVSAR